MPVLYRFPDIASCLHKVSNFFYAPRVFGSPVGGNSVEILLRCCRQISRVSSLPCGVVCVMIHLAVLIEHRLVIDGQTDGQTQCHYVYCASIASRGKNDGPNVKVRKRQWSSIFHAGLSFSVTLLDLVPCDNSSHQPKTRTRSKLHAFIPSYVLGNPISVRFMLPSFGRHATSAAAVL